MILDYDLIGWRGLSRTLPYSLMPDGRANDVLYNFLLIWHDHIRSDWEACQISLSDCLLWEKTVRFSKYRRLWLTIRFQELRSFALFHLIIQGLASDIFIWVPYLHCKPEVKEFDTESDRILRLIKFNQIPSCGTIVGSDGWILLSSRSVS